MGSRLENRKQAGKALQTSGKASPRFQPCPGLGGGGGAEGVRKGRTSRRAEPRVMGATDKGLPLEEQTQDLANGLSLPTGNGAIQRLPFRISSWQRTQDFCMSPILPLSPGVCVAVILSPFHNRRWRVCTEPENLSFESEIASSVHNLRKREIEK